MTYLPDEIWWIICNDLWHQGDLNTLFNCACSGKQLATIAFTNLYRTVPSEALCRWIPQLPRLTLLNSWHGAAIPVNGALIRLHCPLFKGFHVQEWRPELKHRVYDHRLEAFVKELRPQSLESFKASMYDESAPGLFQALCRHGNSLAELKLDICPFATNMPELLLLKCCTNLVSLSLVESFSFDTDHDERSEVFLEIFTWRKNCQQLRNLVIINFIKPTWAALILSEISIHLTSFEYESGPTPEIQQFHPALANQTSLQSLWLRLYPSGGSAAGGLVESLSKLTKLRELRLNGVSSTFTDWHILQLAISLPKLEVWSTSGCVLTDTIWGEVASLKSLRRLVLNAETFFTVDVILEFIDKLSPGNKGLAVSVLNSYMRGNFSWVEHELIQGKIANKIGGSFENILYEYELDDTDQIPND